MVMMMTAKRMSAGIHQYPNMMPIVAFPRISNIIPSSMVCACYELVIAYIDVTDHFPGHCCDALGNPLPPGALLPPWEECLPSDYSPFGSWESFLLADLLFRCIQMSAGNIDDLMECLAHLVPPDQDPPFADSRNLYDTIDAVCMGHIPWHSVKLSY